MYLQMAADCRFCWFYYIIRGMVFMSNFNFDIAQIFIVQYLQ